MSINKKSKVVFYFLTFIILFAAGWYFIQSRSDRPDKIAAKDSTETSSRIQVVDGITTIELSKEEQKNSGITTIKLNQAKHQAQLTAYGTVVSIQDLSKDFQNYEADKVQLAKSQENLLISQKNYERTKSLYEKKFASEQDFQTAQASFLSDQADVSSAKSNLSGLRSSIVEQWGNEISKWIFNNSATLQNLLELKEALIQVSFSPDEMDTKIPENIFIQLPSENGKRISCRFVSAGHLANSQFQTKTLYYIASNTSLSGGMNVRAFLPVGKNSNGVVVPSESILWYQGKEWIYVEKQPDKFIRVEVDTDNNDDGFFIPGNHGQISPGVTVVKEGAQLLLSEELTPTQSSGGGEGDND